MLLSRKAEAGATSTQATDADRPGTGWIQLPHCAGEKQCGLEDVAGGERDCPVNAEARASWIAADLQQPPRPEASPLVRPCLAEPVVHPLADKPLPQPLILHERRRYHLRP